MASAASGSATSAPTRPSSTAYDRHSLPRSPWPLSPFRYLSAERALHAKSQPRSPRVVLEVHMHLIVCIERRAQRLEPRLQRARRVAAPQPEVGDRTNF